MKLTTSLRRLRTTTTLLSRTATAPRTLRPLSSAATPTPPTKNAAAASAAASSTAADESAGMNIQVYGGLLDQDRIFSNIYGEQDWRLKDAEMRGDWYRTKDLLQWGPDGIVNESNVVSVEEYADIYIATENATSMCYI